MVVSDYQNKKMNEKTAKLQFYQVVDTVRYLHSTASRSATGT